MKKEDIHSMSILLIDDSNANTILLKAILNNEGFQNIFVSRSDEATKILLEERNVDLMLISTVLSKGSGIDLCQEISNAPIIPYQIRQQANLFYN